MKKIVALFVALGLVLALFGCAAVEPSSETPAAEEPVTTTTPPPLPPREGAVMPPLQGGPMLYMFNAAEPYGYFPSEYDGSPWPRFHIGLVNDMGEVVTEPRYTFARYAHDAYGRVIGVFAYIERKLTWYTLDGTATIKPFEVAWAESVLNGRYWIVRTRGHGMGSFSIDDGTRDGLYNVEEERFVIEPTDGLQLVGYSGVVFGAQRETESFDSAFLHSFRWNPEDGSRMEYPEGWHVQGYNSETGQYRMVERGEQFEYGSRIFFVDRDMNLLDIEDEIGLGERRGNLWVLHNSLLDSQRDVIHAAQVGQSFVNLYDRIRPGDHGTGPGLVALMDNDRNILEAWCTQTGEPFNMQAHGNGPWISQDGWGGAYRAQNGAWQAIIPSRFLDIPPMEGGVAFIIAVTQAGAIIRVGREEQSRFAETRAIAVDWYGNEADHPLLRFFDNENIWLSFRVAGEQGPNYFWVEHDGQRGFINTNGEWLFIHNEQEAHS